MVGMEIRRHNKEMNLESIKTILDGDIGKPLKNYLLDCLRDLKNIDNVKEYSKAQDQAVELKAQLKAYNKLSRILEEIMSIEEDKDEKQENEYSV